MTIELYPFQVKDSNRASEMSVGLGHETGLGKTLIMAETIVKFYKAHPLTKDPTVIFTLKNVKGQFIDVLKSYFEEVGFSIPIYRDRFFSYKDEPYICVTHHEAARVQVDDFEQVNWALCFVDEAHKLCNTANKFTKALNKIPAYRRIAATGTPFDRDPSKIWSIINWLTAGRHTLGTASQFMNEHTKIEHGKVLGCRNHAAFARAIAPYFIIRKKRDADVFPDLPKKIEKKISIEMTESQQEAYDLIMQALGNEIEIDPANEGFSIAGILAFLTRAQQCTSLPAGIKQHTVDESLKKRTTLPFAAFKESGKINWCVDFVKETEEEAPGTKTIFMSRFSATAQTFYAALEAAGIKAVLIEGGLTEKEFEARRDAYKAPAFLDEEETIPNPKAVNIMVAIIEAGGTGLDLPMTTNTVFIDGHWSSIKMTQAMDRMRDSFDTPKNVYYLVVDEDRNGIPTVDEQVYQAFKTKRTEQQFVAKALNAIQDSYHTPLSDLISFVTNKY